MLKIRETTEEDLPQILDLYKHLHPEDAAAAEPDAEAAWGEILANPGVVIFLAELEDEPVGSCTLVIVPNLTRGARPYAVIENVVIHAGHRRKGYGSQLMRYAISRAYERGCYKVMLLTGSRREETLRFYEEVGLERGIKTGFVAYAESRHNSAQQPTAGSLRSPRGG